MSLSDKIEKYFEDLDDDSFEALSQLYPILKVQRRLYLELGDEKGRELMREIKRGMIFYYLIGITVAFMLGLKFTGWVLL